MPPCRLCFLAGRGGARGHRLAVAAALLGATGASHRGRARPGSTAAGAARSQLAPGGAGLYGSGHLCRAGQEVQAGVYLLLLNFAQLASFVA